MMETLFPEIDAEETGRIAELFLLLEAALESEDLSVTEWDSGSEFSEIQNEEQDNETCTETGDEQNVIDDTMQDSTVEEDGIDDAIQDAKTEYNVEGEKEAADGDEEEEVNPETQFLDTKLFPKLRALEESFGTKDPVLWTEQECSSWLQAIGIRLGPDEDMPTGHWLLKTNMDKEAFDLFFYCFGKQLRDRVKFSVDRLVEERCVQGSCELSIRQHLKLRNAHERSENKKKKATQIQQVAKTWSRRRTELRESKRGSVELQWQSEDRRVFFQLFVLMRSFLNMDHVRRICVLEASHGALLLSLATYFACLDSHRGNFKKQLLGLCAQFESASENRARWRLLRRSLKQREDMISDEEKGDAQGSELVDVDFVEFDFMGEWLEDHIEEFESDEPPEVMLIDLRSFHTLEEQQQVFERTLRVIKRAYTSVMASIAEKKKRMERKKKKKTGGECKLPNLLKEVVIISHALLRIPSCDQNFVQGAGVNDVPFCCDRTRIQVFKPLNTF